MLISAALLLLLLLDIAARPDEPVLVTADRRKLVNCSVMTPIGVLGDSWRARPTTERDEGT